MNKIITSTVMAIALTGITTAQASEFDGGYLGGKIGYNKNSPATSTTSNKIYPGIEAGYGWDVGSVMLGIDGFYDGHSKSITNKDHGADVKLGLPIDKWMPYAKLGMAGSNPGTRGHGGLGIEYKFAPQWSVSGEWTTDRKTVNSVKIKNSNASIGISYYFNKPYVAPAVVAAVAPIIIKKPEPVVAPPPAPAPAPVVVEPAPAPKTIFTDKPITIEGANFDTGSAKLKSTASKQLDVVVEFAAMYPAATLTVLGFTDSRGNEKINQQLSANRAESVKAYLVKKGVNANRILTSGKGSANPVGDNKTDAGRAQNRRVEINSTKREVN